MTEQLQFIATRHNRPIADVRELWSERAAIREYQGGQSRADAERDAVGDVEQWFAGRGK